MACISCTVRCLTKRVSVFLDGIASTRWICSSAVGSRYCMKCMNDLIAARRVFLELMPFPRATSKWPKKSTTSVASICSKTSFEGCVFNRAAANSKSNLKA